MRKLQILILGVLLLTSNVFAQEKKYSLDDFLSNNPFLMQEVLKRFSQLSPEERVAQLIMPAMGRLGQKKEVIDKLVSEKRIGGILMLNGSKEEFTSWIKEYNRLNKELNALPFLYSADAEPSLVNRKILNSTPVKKANQFASIEEVKEVAQTISNDLNGIGINYNFAPVVDRFANEALGFRSFGKQPDHIIPWSNAFIEVSQKNGIITTAKHFPGHGLVEGDSHNKLVYIKGEMKEVRYYPPVIEEGVLSIMIGHIAVEDNIEYNTNGLPSSISKNIVTDLLRDSLQFKGLVVTDAMNMLGVSTIEGANVKAIEAGVDILLMPLDATKAHQEILEKYNSDGDFRKLVDRACMRIIRMKICLG